METKTMADAHAKQHDYGQLVNAVVLITASPTPAMVQPYSGS